MIGPVSETGRNMMASLQQAMSKGMPPDQAIAYVKTMAVDGVAPLTDLYSMMMQFQRLKEPTRRPPEGGSIRQELDTLENMKAPMDQGLGGMDAGVMENPSFAGGGIVAFQQGGMPQTPPMNPAAPDFQQQMLEYMNRFSAPQGQFVDEQMQASEELAKKYGLGQYGEAYKGRQAQAAEMQRALPEQRAEERKLDRAEFFFNLAAAAADPGATFATSLGKAGSSYTKAQRTTNERLRGLQKEAQEAGLKLLEAEQLRKQGDVNAAQRMFTEGQKQAVETGMKIWEETGRREDAASMREAMKYQSDASLRGLSGVEARLARQIELDETLTPQQKFEALRAGRRTSPNLQVMRDTLRSTTNEIRDAKKKLDDPVVKFDKARVAEIQREISRLEARQFALLEDYPELREAISGGEAAPAGGNVLRYNPKTGEIE
jgi:hypothetical protein